MTNFDRAEIAWEREMERRADEYYNSMYESDDESDDEVINNDCEECGENPADAPSKLCSGCNAYKDHY